MKSTKFFSLPALTANISFLTSHNANAQNTVPADVVTIATMDFEQGQEKLSSLGYEIRSSSLFGKKQDWFNESTQNCDTVKFDKKKVITEVVPNPDLSKCQKGLDASLKVWEKYHDSQAPVRSARLDEERKKLVAKRFKVSYWIDEVMPGHSSEYWVNETTQKTRYSVREIQDNKWVMTETTDYKMDKNPAPKKIKRASKWYSTNFLVCVHRKTPWIFSAIFPFVNL